MKNIRVHFFLFIIYEYKSINTSINIKRKHKNVLNLETNWKEFTGPDTLITISNGNFNAIETFNAISIELSRFCAIYYENAKTAIV